MSSVHIILMVVYSININICFLKSLRRESWTLRTLIKIHIRASAKAYKAFNFVYNHKILKAIRVCFITLFFFFQFSISNNSFLFFLGQNTCLVICVCLQILGYKGNCKQYEAVWLAEKNAIFYIHFQFYVGPIVGISGFVSHTKHTAEATTKDLLHSWEITCNFEL